jgi:hypothetical protein
VKNGIGPITSARRSHIQRIGAALRQQLRILNNLFHIFFGEPKNSSKADLFGILSALGG